MTKCKYTLADNKGLTLVEIVVSVVIFALIIPGLVTYLASTTNGFTAYEATNQLKKNNQESLNRMYLRIVTSRRIFENNSVGTAYLGKLSLTNAPAVLTGSKLPTIEEGGSLATGTTSFISGSVGNCMFFASNDLTVVSSYSVLIDVYKFNYYYLTSVNPKSIFDKPSYRLVEWQSVKFADYNQIIFATTATVKRANIVKSLYNEKGIQYAWVSSENDITKACYQLDSNGNISPIGSPTISPSKCTVLTKIMTGLLGGGYKYGISPNSSGWARAPKTIPQYAVASGNFPGGLEIVIIGSSSGRMTLIRSVLVAQGSMPSIISNDQIVVCTSRDLW